MVRAGLNEHRAMAVSGHKTRAIFDRYDITSDDDQRQALKQTQEYLKAQPAVSNVVKMRTGTNDPKNEHSDLLSPQEHGGSSVNTLPNTGNARPCTGPQPARRYMLPVPVKASSA
jgi:hypothetical protein